MIAEEELFPVERSTEKQGKYTEGVALSGTKTPAGRTSGETIDGAEGANTVILQKGSKHSLFAKAG